MKKSILFILLIMSHNAFSYHFIEDVSLNMTEEREENSNNIQRLNEILITNDIDIFYSEWEENLNKKCNWIRTKISPELYGQEDLFSYELCILFEQHSFINRLIELIHYKNIPFINANELKINMTASKQFNPYFNYLTENYAHKFCDSVYTSNEVINCVNVFLLHQFIPEDYDFKIVLDKADLFSAPSLVNKTKMYLTEEDKIKLLKRQDDFYLIEFSHLKKSKIKKWIHCQAVDACE